MKKRFFAGLACLALCPNLFFAQTSLPKAFLPEKSVMQVVFPQDICIPKETSYEELLPELLPKGNDYPILKNVSCAQQEVSYTDIIEKRAFTSTYRITRIWKVADPCDESFAPIEHKQHINTSVLASGPGMSTFQVEKNLLQGETDAVQLFQNRPNPYTQHTVISFYLPSDADIDLIVRDLSGKEIKRIHDSYSRGYHDVAITPEDIQTAGIYYYSLTVGDFHATKSLVLVKN